MKHCTCSTCILVGTWKQRNVPQEFIDYALDLKMSVEYYEAILDGVWPSAIPVLEAAIERAKENGNEQERIYGDRGTCTRQQHSGRES